MLDGVSLDQLRAFIAAVDEGSFSAGARKLHRAQSAVSDSSATSKHKSESFSSIAPSVTRSSPLRVLSCSLMRAVSWATWICSRREQKEFPAAWSRSSR